MAIRKGIKRCAKSLLCNVVSARIAITPPPKTRRSTPNAWRPGSFAVRAASTRITKRPNDDPMRIVILRCAFFARRRISTGRFSGTVPRAELGVRAGAGKRTSSSSKGRRANRSPKQGTQNLRPQDGLTVKGSRPTVRTPVSKTGYGGSNPSSPARNFVRTRTLGSCR
jgi:hypothetical protein